LQKAEYDAPLLAVELSYRFANNYVPLVIAATARDADALPVLPSTVDPKRWISLNQEDFEPGMADFLERMGTAQRWDAGTRMLREAALMVNRLADGALRTADTFVAWAIDWEIEGEQFPVILKRCGASP